MFRVESRPIKQHEVIQVGPGLLPPDDPVDIAPPASRIYGLYYIDQTLLNKIQEAQERIAQKRLVAAQGECALAGTCSLRLTPNHNGRLDGKRELIFSCPRKGRGCADRVEKVTQQTVDDIELAMKRVDFWADQQK